jgi:hypothetical protein
MTGSYEHGNKLPYFMTTKTSFLSSSVSVLHGVCQFYEDGTGTTQCQESNPGTSQCCSNTVTECFTDEYINCPNPCTAILHAMPTTVKKKLDFKTRENRYISKYFEL